MGHFKKKMQAGHQKHKEKKEGINTCSVNAAIDTVNHRRGAVGETDGAERETRRDQYQRFSTGFASGPRFVIGNQVGNQNCLAQMKQKCP